MNAKEPTRTSPVADAEVLAQMDAYCERLRRNIEQNGHGPIEELLQEAPDALRERLFEELVVEDAQMRLLLGEKPTLDEYLKRFPDRREILERALESVICQASFSTTGPKHDTNKPDHTQAPSSSTA